MFRKVLIILVGLAVLMAACSPTPATEVHLATEVPTQAPTAPPTEAPTVEPIALIDGLGRMVELTRPAQRIVSLTAATTEILFAIGAGSQVVGRDMFSDYPDAALDVIDIGGSWGEYNSEAIVNLQPDLVIAGGINPPELVASLENLGLTVYFLSNPVTLDELYVKLSIVGDLTGHEMEALDLSISLEARAKAVDDALSGGTEKPVVYYELDATPFTAGPGTFVDQLIDRAGGVNFGASMESAWAQVNLEQIVLTDPDMIILGDSAYGETAETVAARPGWDSLSAVSNQMIFAFDDNLVSRPGPRLVDGLEALARLIHPELFK
jgi:iron complex transport system substrate-binding protein